MIEKVPREKQKIIYSEIERLEQTEEFQLPAQLHVM
jgi:hypothetical protein